MINWIKCFFDILAINESKIDESIPDNEISIPGYNLIRKDRNRAGGGVVLYIRDNIPFSDRKDLVPSSLEMVCAEINRPHSKSFLVCTWYRPPNSDMDLFNECEIFFQRCDADSRELILVGDLNCDVSKVSLDPHTRQLIFLCSLYQIDQLIDKPTRVTDTSATLIDLVWTNVKENIHASGIIHLGTSDQSLIYAVRKFVLKIIPVWDKLETISTSMLSFSLKTYPECLGTRFNNSIIPTLVGMYGNPFLLIH